MKTHLILARGDLCALEGVGGVHCDASPLD